MLLFREEKVMLNAGYLSVDPPIAISTLQGTYLDLSSVSCSDVRNGPAGFLSNGLLWTTQQV